MSLLYLVRHGQAGTRSNYDTLSDLGAEQSRWLGEYLRALGPVRAIAGGLIRQQETARQAGFADMVTDPGWSEFDLDAVYREIAPQIAAADPEFRQEYEQLLAAVPDDGHPVHRKWTRGDVKVVLAWVEGRVPVRETESFAQFRDRVRAAFERITRDSLPAVVFTSATPIALTLEAVLSVPPRETMKLAGALLNGSLTVLRHGSEWSLSGFNYFSHLREPRLWTSR
jgi:broad specificity phosphatase PhoE